MDCVRCGWVVNRPLRYKQLKRLVAEISHLLGEEELYYAVMNRIKEEMRMKYPLSGEVPICRYCLLELFLLFARDNKEKEVKKLIRTYDFQGAIIT
ncbi:hypothetical protein DRN62_03970 [Nanoarchaeota archaeon]|nr:MAG: hypothetical protein DRN62_03970 [Nanoarchaeota archaeon]